MNAERVAKIRRFLADRSITPGERVAAEAALARLLRSAPRPERTATARPVFRGPLATKRPPPSDEDLFGRFFDVLDQNGVRHA